MKWLGGWIAIAAVLSGCDCGGKSDSAARWLNLEIEHPEMEAPVFFENQYGEIGEDGLVTNTFYIHPLFLTMAPQPGGGDGSAAPDPFAAPDRDGGPVFPRKRMPARKVLEAYGVEFGPGASAHFNPKTNTLRVTQTPDQMDLIVALIYSICITTERSISVLFEIFELPADEALIVEQSAGERFEHSREHDVILERVKEDSARIVTSARFISRSGQRAAYEDAEEVRYVSGFTKAVEDDTKSPLPVFAVEKVGTVVEVDPVLGPDDLTIDVNIKVDHHLAPPVWPGDDDSKATASGRPQFQIGSISTSEMILSGQVKLLCSWAVPGEAKQKRLRRLVFVTANVVRG